MKIEIESTMRTAARDGIDAFQPVFRGQPLEVEASLPEVSLRNLRALLKAGLEVATMTVVEHGHVFVAFKTGETYLATGFAVGQFSQLSHCFAQFAAEALGGDVSGWENHLGGMYREDEPGLIAPCLTPPGIEPGESGEIGFSPRVFKGDAEKI